MAKMKPEAYFMPDKPISSDTRHADVIFGALEQLQAVAERLDWLKENPPDGDPPTCDEDVTKEHYEFAREIEKAVADGLSYMMSYAHWLHHNRPELWEAFMRTADASVKNKVN